MQYFSVAIVLLLLAPALAAEHGQEELRPGGRDGTLNTTLERNADQPNPSTGLDLLTTMEEDWSPFPPGDILNNAFLRKAKFCHVLCYDETKLEGLRNSWPFVYLSIGNDNGQITFSTLLLNNAKVIAIDPILRAKIYCQLLLYPLWEEWSVQCIPGNATRFLEMWKDSPIGMLRENITLSVFNAILASLSLILGIFGNMLIIVSVLVKKELQSSTNVILVGMAVADCLNSVTIVFYGYLDTFLATITNPILGPVGCAAIRTLKEFTQFAAVNHLITLSFERYFTICWPMKTSLKFTSKKTFLIIIVNWFISGVMAYGHLALSYSFDYYIDNPQHLCNLSSYNELGRVVYDVSVYLVVPVPILCFNYISVVRSLRTSIKKSREMTEDSSRQTTAEKARLKLTYMMIILVVIYIITVTPSQILQAYMNLDFGTSRTFSFRYGKKITGAIDMVRGINSWTNVVVYAIISRQFRAAFKEVLCHCCKKPSGADSVSGNPAAIKGTPAGTMKHKV